MPGFVVISEYPTSTLGATLDTIVKQEDVVHVSGEKGIMALAVRNNGLADFTSADRDYSAIAVDAKGRIILDEAVLIALAAKFGTLGQKASSGSAPVVLSTAQETILTAIQTALGAATPAGENHIGSVGGSIAKLYFPVTTSATAYTANDNIGGIQTLTNLLRVSGGSGILEDLDFWAVANQKPNLYIDFWDASPSGTYTNDAAQVIAGDHAKWLGFVEIPVADWKDTGTISRVSMRGLGITLKGAASANIYMTIQDKTGVTFGSVAGLFFRVGNLQD